jgi:hypothetical protein
MLTESRIQTTAIDRVKDGIYVKESSFPVTRITSALVTDAIIMHNTARRFFPKMHCGILIHDGNHPALKPNIDIEELSASPLFAEVRRQRSSKLTCVT